MEFEIPEDIASLNIDQFANLVTSLGDDEFGQFLTTVGDDDLAGLQETAVAAFDTKYTATSITPSDLAAARKIKASVDRIRGERARRQQEAEAAAAELDALAAEVHGIEDGDGDEGGEVEASAPAPVPEPQAAPAPEPEPAKEGVVVAASAARRPALDLSGVRRRQPRVLPEPPAPMTEITAAVDVPGYVPGQRIEFDQITSGIISRANALKTAGGGVGQVISYRHPYPRELQVTDSSSAPEGTTVALAAQNQRRLPKGDLVASGGWCAPSETIYDILDVACPEMLWDAPEIQLSRGGIRYFKTPSLDVAAMTFVHTEADDISGAEKPCFQIPCPEPTEVRCTAYGACITAGILTQRHFPELVTFYLRQAMVAHEIRVRTALFQEAVAAATPVTLSPTFAALSAVFSAVALQATDMIERHSLCENTSLEVVFPFWARNLFLADLARQNGVNVCDLNPMCIQDLFSTLGVRVQFVRGLPPAVPTDIGGPNPALDWPDQLQFLIYPAGQLLIGRGEEVNLGVIHDSVRFTTNDYTALFSEECSALVDRSVDTRIVTVPVCPSGETGAQTALTCPAA